MRLIDADRLCEDLLNRWSIADTKKEELIRQVMADIVTPIVVSQPTVNQWIPVSERLPKDKQEILFSTKTGRVHSGRYHDDNSVNQWYSHKDRARAWNNVVIAWMPLPEPWKGEEQ